MAGLGSLMFNCYRIAYCVLYLESVIINVAFDNCICYNYAVGRSCVLQEIDSIKKEKKSSTAIS